MSGRLIVHSSLFETIEIVHIEIIPLEREKIIEGIESADLVSIYFSLEEIFYHSPPDSRTPLENDDTISLVVSIAIYIFSDTRDDSWGHSVKN